MKLQSNSNCLPQRNFESISSWMKTAGTSSARQKTEAQPKFVLLVDSKPMRQFYTSIFLQRLKYHVMMAKTAEDALLFMGVSVPLVIVANVDLPQMSGVDLLKQVKQNRRTREIPFLIYTSNKDPHIRQVCEQAGCAVYLAHPDKLDLLYAAIQKTTKKSRRFVRLDTSIDVIVGDSLPAGSLVRRDYISVISEQGIFVHTNNPLTYGGIHTFTFFLPNAPGWVFSIEGQILYRHPSADSRQQPGMGVKFLKIGDQERELIKDFIRIKTMEGIM